MSIEPSSMWPTERPWPRGSYPTDEQLAEWMRVATEEERIAFASQALEAIQSHRMCLVRHP